MSQSVLEWVRAMQQQICEGMAKLKFLILFVAVIAQSQHLIGFSVRRFILHQGSST